MVVPGSSGLLLFFPTRQRCARDFPLWWKKGYYLNVRDETLLAVRKSRPIREMPRSRWSVDEGVFPHLRGREGLLGASSGNIEVEGLFLEIPEIACGSVRDGQRCHLSGRTDRIDRKDHHDAYHHASQE